MIDFSGLIWRIVFAGQDASQPARAPEGRFHRSGQWALYASLSAEGCGVAIRRYLRQGDPARQIVAFRLRLQAVADLRNRPEVSVVWQDLRAIGAPAPSWVFSDAARAAGAQGLLYSSRSRPELSHLALFDPSVALAPAGAPQPWRPGCQDPTCPPK